MIENKMRHLEMTNQKDRMRWIGSLKNWMLKGLPHNGWANTDSLLRQASSSLGRRRSFLGDSPNSMIVRFQEWLKWEPADDKSSRKTGRTLLFYASLCNSAELVQVLLEEHGRANINVAVRNPDAAMGEWPLTPLMAGMAFADFPVVELLLDARARPDQRMTIEEGHDAFMFSACIGRDDNISAWLSRFGGAWPLERREFTGGLTVLQLAATVGSTSVAGGVVRVLLDARANPHATSDVGINMFNCVCTNPNSVPHLVPLLAAEGVNVNYHTKPQTLNWRVIETFTRWLARLGTTSTLIRAIASWEGDVPLMATVEHGKVAEIQAMLAARADPTLFNRQGRNALDLAREHYGGIVPPLLAQLLATSSSGAESLPYPSI